MEARVILRLEKLGFNFPSRTVLDNFSLNVRQGEIVSLLGHSGCGKTTLLNIIAGFLKPTAGLAFLNEREISGPGPDRGVVFQSYALFDWMTIEDNIAFGLRCKGVKKDARRSVASEIVAMVGLKGFECSYPYELSGGMRQRCALARVLATKPAIMLMDEPFAAVDVQTREALQEEILRIQGETNSTIIFVTHSIDEAVFISNRIILFKKAGHGDFEEFKVNLPSPRADSMNRVSQSFNALRARIYETMRSID